LKEAYRKTIARGLPRNAYTFVFLHGSKELIAQRLSTRTNHYMNPALLDSQLATLEPPVDALRVANNRAPQDVVDSILKHLEQ
jgi:gluconokinase